METNKNGKHHGGSAFLWGFILGAIFASLLFTKKGRSILRELINTGLAMIEEFMEEKRQADNFKQTVATQNIRREADQAASTSHRSYDEPRMAEEEYLKEADEDINSEITEDEAEPVSVMQESEEVEELEMDEVESERSPQEAAAPAQKSAAASERGAGELKKRGSKRRLFRGVKRKYAN